MHRDHDLTLAPLFMLVSVKARRIAVLLNPANAATAEATSNALKRAAPGTFENTTGIDSHLTEYVAKAGTVAHQQARRDSVARKGGC
jgi:hypothetical protein